ncbi:MAG: hypothetical protein KC609_17310, partial [Myxococcales bacterium]|nr:hypothetical protein [Myxococcales bacterium]
DKLIVRLSKEDFTTYEKSYTIVENDQKIVVPALTKDPPKPETAQLVVTVNPPTAIVMVNGKRVAGNGTFTVPGLAVGQTVSLMVIAPGHDAYINSKVSISEATTSLPITLRKQVVKQGAQLIVDANVRALVFVNGGLVGPTPATVKVTPGNQRVEVRHQSQIKKFDLVLRAGENKSLYATF